MTLIIKLLFSQELRLSLTRRDNWSKNSLISAQNSKRWLSSKANLNTYWTSWKKRDFSVLNLMELFTSTWNSIKSNWRTFEDSWNMWRHKWLEINSRSHSESRWCTWTRKSFKSWTQIRRNQEEVHRRIRYLRVNHFQSTTRNRCWKLLQLKIILHHETFRTSMMFSSSSLCRYRSWIPSRRNNWVLYARWKLASKWLKKQRTLLFK